MRGRVEQLVMNLVWSDFVGELRKINSNVFAVAVAYSPRRNFVHQAASVCDIEKLYLGQDHISKAHLVKWYKRLNNSKTARIKLNLVNVEHCRLAFADYGESFGPPFSLFRFHMSL